MERPAVDIPQPVPMGPPLKDLTQALAPADELDDVERLGAAADGQGNPIRSTA